MPINPLATLLTDPVRNFKFLVTFSLNLDGVGASTPGLDGNNPNNKFGHMGFVSLSGLSVSTESIAYREGGYNTNLHQMPGQSSFTPITLSRGVLLGTDSNVKWMKRLFSVTQPSGQGNGVGGAFRTTLDIQVLSHPNPAAFEGSDVTTANIVPESQHTSMRFRVYNAWISSLAYSPLDAGSNALMVEEMTLVHEGFDVNFGKNLEKDGSAPLFT